MEESFLHFIWQHGFFNSQNLQTTTGQAVQIVKRGFLNHNSGPDFSDARIVIDGFSWAGNVEIHTKASDWNRHKHQNDPAYNNTILHVVFSADLEVQTQCGSVPPCLELEKYIPLGMYEKSQGLIRNLQTISCASNQPAKYETSVSGSMHRALTDRMILKADRILQLAKDSANDWQTVFYICIARYLGFKVNTDSMEILARITPQSILARCKDNLMQIESILFGQAGMLQGKARDDYQKELAAEYSFQIKKHTLLAMQVSAWKFMRLRPPNFPTIRIAQLAALVCQSSHLFSKIILEKDPKNIKTFFSVAASDYWTTHYRFGEKSNARLKTIGETTINGLLINAVSPVLFAYGVHQSNENLKERAFDLLSSLNPEDNRVVREWEKLGFPNPTAYESQAMLGLRELYCDKKRCLECSIGMRIISP